MNNIQNMQVFFEDFFSVNMEADQKYEKVQHYPVACEKSIKKDSDYDRQISKVDATTITLKPNNNLDICRHDDWNFPEISFTVRELREHLENYLSTETRKVEGWILGGAANPACLPYNDIDLGFYIPNADYNTIDRLIMEFIRTKLIEKRPSHSGYYPIDKGFMIYKVYYSGRTIFKDQAGAFYGLQGLQIKIFDFPHFHCVGPADGAQASPSRRILRFATGKDFAVTDQQFYEALSACQNKVYDVLDLHGHRDLIFRLIFKQTAGHRIKPELFNLAVQQLHAQLQGEYKEKQEKGFARRTFNKIGAQQSPAVQPALTMLELLSAKLKNHQTNHYGSVPGKIIDFLNFMSVLHPVNQRELAQAWLEKAEALGLKEINSFAGLIVKCPEMTPHLLAFMRGVFFCEWAHQAEGQKGRLFAYERGLPKVQEVVEDKIRNELGLPPADQLGHHIALKESGHTYYLTLPEHGSPVQVASELLSALPKLQKMLAEHAPNQGLGILKQVFSQFKFSAAYIGNEPEAYIGNRLLTAFDAPHVQETIQLHFKNHGDPKIVISQLRGHLKDPADLALHSHKMAVLSIERCQSYSKIIPDLQPCCQLILKYARKEYKKPSGADLDQLILLSERILNYQVGKDTSFLTFFKSNFTFLVPGIIQNLLACNDEAVFSGVKRLYEAAVRNGLLAPNQELNILEQILKISKQYPASHDRFAREWEIRFSTSALERGILTDKDAFILHLQRLVQSKNPQYLLYLHRYVNTLLSWKDIPRGSVCNILFELLSASLDYEIPSLDKQCFATLLKLYHHDEKLFGIFLATHAPALIAKLGDAAVRLAGGEPVVFDALAAIFSSGKKVADPQKLLSLFKAQFLYLPSLCTLHQAGNMAQTAIKLLQSGIQLDSQMLQQCLDRLALPLLGATQHKADAARFKALGENLLGLLFQADKDVSWQALIRQRLMVRMANAVAKQSGFIRAQEQLVNYTKAFKSITEKHAFSEILQKFELLLKEDFLESQTLRAKMLLQTAKALDCSFLEQEAFQRLDQQFGEKAEKTIQKQKVDPIQEGIRAAEKLCNLFKAEKLGKIYSLSRRILNSIEKITSGKEVHTKEQLSSFSASLEKALIGMAACAKLNTVRTAKELFDSAKAAKLFDAKQEGCILLELFKGHVIVESLHPEMDFNKDILNYFEGIIKQLRMCESDLGIEGSLAMLNMAEKVMSRSSHNQEQAGHIIFKMLEQPSKSAFVHQKLISAGLKLVAVLFKSKNAKDFESGLKRLLQLLSSEIPSSKKIISDLEKCLVILMENEAMSNAGAIDKPLETIVATLYGQKLFDHFFEKTIKTLMKSLILTNRANLRDLIVKMIPGWGKDGNVNAYERLMRYLNEICLDGDLKLMRCAANFFNAHYATAKQILSPVDKVGIINDCLISIYARLKDKDRLAKACHCFNTQKITSQPHAIRYLIIGISELSKEHYDDFFLTIFDKLLSQSLEAAAKCTQAEVDLISEPLMDLCCFGAQRYSEIFGTKLEVGKPVLKDSKPGKFLPEVVFLSKLGGFSTQYFRALRQNGKVACNSQKLVLWQLENYKPGGVFSGSDIVDFYKFIKDVYDPFSLKFLQTCIEDIVKDKTKQLFNLEFMPVEVFRKEVEVLDKYRIEQVSKKLREQLNEARKLFNELYPLYILCSPELGRQAAKFILTKIFSYEFDNRPLITFDFIKSNIGLFDSKRVDLFQVVPLTGEEQFEVNKQYLDLYANAFDCEIKNQFVKVFRQHDVLICKEFEEFLNLIKKWKQYSFLKDLPNFQIPILKKYFVNAIIAGKQKEFLNQLEKFEQEIEWAAKSGLHEYVLINLNIAYAIPAYFFNLFVCRAIVKEAQTMPGDHSDLSANLCKTASVGSILAKAKILQKEPFSEFPDLDYEFVGLDSYVFFGLLSTDENIFKFISDESQKKCCDLSLYLLDRLSTFYFKYGEIEMARSASAVVAKIFLTCVKGKERNAYIEKYRAIQKKHEAKAKGAEKSEGKQEPQTAAPTSKSTAKKKNKKVKR